MRRADHTCEERWRGCEMSGGGRGCCNSKTETGTYEVK
jgi:hypothetical protein